MFIVNSYMLAVIFCFITMLCWGSWGNTQKLAGKTWRYELFYWDYVVGMVLFAALLGFTMGSTGDEGRSFVRDLAQADWRNIGSVVAGGAIFNASNILLSASVSLAGMAVAFPLGVGLALVLGVFINWFGAPKGDPVVLFAGVALIVAAIVCNGLASARMNSGRQSGGSNRKGLMLAVAAGALMSMFYRFVAAAMDLDHFENPTEGMLTPYSAIFVFSVGVLLSNFVFNTLAMRHPFVGDRVGYGEWFRGSAATHLVGMLGGAIWCLGLYSRRQGRSCDIIRSGSGRADDRRHLGRIRLEGVPRCRQTHRRPAGADVHALRGRIVDDSRGGRKGAADGRPGGAACGAGNRRDRHGQRHRRCAGARSALSCRTRGQGRDTRYRQP